VAVKKTKVIWTPTPKPRKAGDAAEFVKRSHAASPKAMKKLR